jgi:ankyrin repeat protein
MQFAKKYPNLKNLVESVASNIDATDSDGRTLLSHALSRCDFNFAKVLLVQGANVNCSSNSKETPLLDAISCTLPNDVFSNWGVSADNGEEDIFNLLIDKGAEISKTPKGVLPLLHLAVDRRRLRIVLSFLRAGADIDEIDDDGNTPLHIAAWNGDIALVELLLKWGANVNIKNNDGETAADRSWWDEIRMLINKYETGTLPQDKKSLYEANNLVLNFAKTASTLAMYLNSSNEIEEAAEIMVLLREDPEALSFARQFVFYTRISLKDYVYCIKTYNVKSLYENKLLPPNFIITK